MLPSYDIRARLGTQFAWNWAENVGWDHRREILDLLKMANILHLRTVTWPDQYMVGSTMLTSQWWIRYPYYVHQRNTEKNADGSLKWPDSGWLQTMAEEGFRFLWHIGEPWQGMLDNSKPFDLWTGPLDMQIDTIARRYADVTDGLEAPNEYDNPSPTSPNVIQPWDDNLREWINRAGFIWQSDARVNSLPFVGPSFVWDSSAATLGSMAGVLDQKNAHPYSGNKVYQSGWAQKEKTDLDPMLPASAPIVATEFGVKPGTPPAGWGTVNERQQAILLLKQHLTLILNGFARNYIYAAVDVNDNFGFINNDLTPRQAYYALARMTSLAGAKPTSGAPATLTPVLTKADGTAVPSTVKSMVTYGANGKYHHWIWSEAPLGTAPLNCKVKYPGKSHLLPYDLIDGGACTSPKDAADITFDFVLADEPLVNEVN